MNNLLVSFILCFLSFGLSSQVISGVVVDSKTKQGLPYVNIGILGSNIGGISNTKGAFRFDVTSRHLKDSVTFSYIGYESVKVPVSDLLNGKNTVTILTTKNHLLSEIHIVSTKKPLTIGNKRRFKGHTGWGNGVKPSDGKIRGYIIHNKHKRVFIESLSFKINKNSYDSVRFRLNILTVKNDLPDKNLLEDNIFITTSRKKGWVSLDLSKYNIAIENSFFAGLEWVDAWGAPHIRASITIEMSKKPGLSYMKNGVSAIWELFSSEKTPALYFDVYPIAED